MRTPACYDSRRRPQHEFSRRMLEEVYENARTVPYMNCPLCGRNRPLFIKSEFRTQQKPRVFGKYQPGVRAYQLGPQSMVRWDHFSPDIDELLELRVAMPRIQLDDVPKALRQYLTKVKVNQRGGQYWAGGWQYFAGMTIDEIERFTTSGTRSSEIKKCVNQWFHDIEPGQLARALRTQMEAIQKQIDLLAKSFGEAAKT